MIAIDEIAGAEAGNSEAFKEVAKKNNATVRDIFWTLGAHDVVSIVDAPSDEAIISVGLALGMQGNVCTQTLRAFNATEMSKLLGGLG